MDQGSAPDRPDPAPQDAGGAPASRRRSPAAVGFFGVMLGVALVVPLVTWAFAQSTPPTLSDSPYLRIDPEKIVLSERDSRVPCGECHNLEYEVWQETQHATGFDELHRSEQAQAILDRMDFRLSKRESLCLKCHYTANIKRDQVQAIAGVSCESCHGAGRDWVNVHQDYGGATHETETPEHAAMRVAQSIEGGMLRPSSDLYAVAANCFECHTVPEEKLINVGGHPSGSAFDLVEWSGQISHNFLQAQWGGPETDRERSPERTRLMFVVGKMLDYEYSIRGAAQATKQDIYSKAMERRVKTARRDLDRLLRVAEIPEVAAILRIGQDLPIAPGNEDALLAAADAIGEQAQAFAQETDGGTLAALDPAIAGESIPEAEEPDEVIADAGALPGDSGAALPAVNPGTAPDADLVASGPSAPAAPVVAGEKRTRPAWFPRLNQETVAPGGCGCHGDQLRWHDGDAHYASAEPILNESQQAVQIATLYGLSTAQMKQGNQMCMNCHGTVVSGDEAFEAFDGVGCQSCHGPAAEYASAHQSGGYDQGAPLGMVRLEQPAARAANCARCHHITDERLLASGHADGTSFQLGSRNQAIKHWEAPTHSAGDLNSAYRSAIASRPVPTVQVAPPPVVAASSASSGGSRPARRAGGSPAAAPPAPPRPRPVARRASGAAALDLDLPPLPAVSDSTATEDILLVIKQRLERIAQALGGG